MTVKLSIENKIATITMDDGKANAVNETLIDELHAALDEAEANADAVILTGREGKFSAGFDLSVLGSGDPKAAERLVKRGGGIALRLFTFPLPVIAACNGHGIAMGCFMLLSSDVRIGVDGPFKIGANETAIGMSLPVFALELTKARLRHEKLTEAVIQGTLYAPKGAAEVGFLDEVVSADQLMVRARAEAERLGALPRAAFKANKHLIRRLYIDTIEPTVLAQ
ncbi:MAG: crotonase/enoyl-CoA hydratase family protein [Pseudomonadota bacterium]